VLSATASRDPIVTRTQVAAALARAGIGPMLLLDLAVPRDIAADVATLKDVFLYTVDDLERAIEDNRRSRREAAREAESIVDLQTARFVETLQASTRHAPLKRVRAHGERARAEASPRRARNSPRAAIRTKCSTCSRTRSSTACCTRRPPRCAKPR
jgi:glutamyl-tRNA reductase